MNDESSRSHAIFTLYIGKLKNFYINLLKLEFL
jgi:hypothetical protein